MRAQGAAGTAVRVLGNMYSTAFTGDRRAVAEQIREYVKSTKHPDHGSLARDLPDHVATIQDALAYLEDSAVIENRAEALLEVAKRRLLRNAGEYCQTAADGQTDVDIALSQTFGELADIYSGGVDMTTIEQQGDDLMADYENKEQRGTALTGIPTGMPNIDLATCGLQWGEMNVLAARTRHGKSALAVNYIAPNAAREGYPVLVIGHEMPPDMYTLRMACADAGVDFNTANRANLHLNTKERLYQSIRRIQSLPITILDAANQNPAELMAHVMSWRQQQGRRGLVIVDHLQNETIPDWRGQRHEMYARISAQWKSCFRVAGCSGLVIAQLNRGAAGQAPKLEQLRDSGAVEQDAMAVMLLYRPGVEVDKQPANQACVALPKNRNGALAYEYLHFQGYCMAFRSWQSTDTQRTDAEMRDYEHPQVVDQSADAQPEEDI